MDDVLNALVIEVDREEILSFIALTVLVFELLIAFTELVLELFIAASVLFVKFVLFVFIAEKY